MVGTWTAEPARGLEDAFYTTRGYALDTFNYRFSDELALDQDPALEEWLELAARGEWATIDRIHGLLGQNATAVISYKEAVQAARLTRRLASGRATADDLFALKRASWGPSVLAQYEAEVWPVVLEGSLDDDRLRDEFAVLLRGRLSDLQARAAGALRQQPPGAWQPHWRLLWSLLQATPALLRETLECILPEPPLSAELRFAILAELQPLGVSSADPRVPLHTLLKNLDEEELDRFARSNLPREWFIWAICYAVLRPETRGAAAPSARGRGRPGCGVLAAVPAAARRGAAPGHFGRPARHRRRGGPGPAVAPAGERLHAPGPNAAVAARFVGGLGAGLGRVLGPGRSPGPAARRARDLGQAGSPIWERFCGQIDRGVLPPGDAYQHTLLMNLVAVQQRPGPALPHRAAEVITDWALLRDHFEKASALPAEQRATLIQACNRCGLDPLAELTTYFTRYVQPQTMREELLADFAGFVNSFYPEPVEYPEFGARLIAWLQIVGTGSDGDKTELCQRYYFAEQVPPEFRRRLAEELFRAGKLLPAVHEAVGRPPAEASETLPPQLPTGADPDPAAEPKPAHRWTHPATLVLALLALAVSAGLLVGHFRPTPLLCGFESSCREVLSSRLGSILGVPLPAIGVLAFAAVFGLGLVPGSRAGRWLRPLALGVGAGGLVLLFVQFLLLRRVCPLCVTVDTAAVALGIVQLAWGGAARAVRFRRVWLGAGIAAVGLGAGVAVAGSRDRIERRPPPPQVTALWVPDKLNVVEVADFQCPHCRRMHAIVKRFVEEQGDRVHFVRLTAPMPGHAQARDASRAFQCAAEQGRGDEMAEALFTARDLRPGAVTTWRKRSAWPCRPTRRASPLWGPTPGSMTSWPGCVPPAPRACRLSGCRTRWCSACRRSKSCAPRPSRQIALGVARPEGTPKGVFDRLPPFRVPQGVPHADSPLACAAGSLS